MPDKTFQSAFVTRQLQFFNPGSGIFIWWGVTIKTELVCQKWTYFICSSSEPKASYKRML